MVHSEIHITIMSKAHRDIALSEIFKSEGCYGSTWALPFFFKAFGHFRAKSMNVIAPREFDESFFAFIIHRSFAFLGWFFVSGRHSVANDEV